MKGPANDEQAFHGTTWGIHCYRSRAQRPERAGYCPPGENRSRRDAVAEASVLSRQEEGCGGGGSEQTPPMESAKCAEGLALRGICITRADSYKPPPDDHLEYTGDCNNEDLPTGNVQEADNTDAGGGEAAGGAKEVNEWIGPALRHDVEVAGQTRPGDNDIQDYHWYLRTLFANFIYRKVASQLQS